MMQNGGSNIASIGVNSTSSTWTGAGGIALNLVATGADISFQAGNPASNVMVVKSTGNVLIGKTTQSNTTYKLDISGSALANAIVVNTTGADFVFESNYKLLSLNDVNNYISANHHLQGIARAEEMQANGLNLGENQTKLLQKVEELTLYLIDLNKKLDTQTNKVRKLEAALRHQRKSKM